MRFFPRCTKSYLYLESNCREPLLSPIAEAAAIGGNLRRQKDFPVDQIQRRRHEEEDKSEGPFPCERCSSSNARRSHFGKAAFSSPSSSSSSDESDDSGVDDDCDGRGSKQSAGFPPRNKAHGETAAVVIAGPEIGSEGRNKSESVITTIPPHQALGEIGAEKNNESISSVSSGMNVEKNKRDFRGYFFAAASRTENEGERISVSPPPPPPRSRCCRCRRPAFPDRRGGRFPRKNSPATFTSSCETYKKYYLDAGCCWWVSEQEDRIPFAMRVSIARGIRRRQMAWNKRSRRIQLLQLRIQQRRRQRRHGELASLLDKTRAITLPKKANNNNNWQRRRRKGLKFYSRLYATSRTKDTHAYISVYVRL